VPNELNIIADGDGCWPDLNQKRAEGKLIDLMGNDTGPILSLAKLDKGTVGGRSTVTLRIDLPDGKVVLTEVTVRLLKAAVEIFEKI
jgi:hypothetical protein